MLSDISDEIACVSWNVFLKDSELDSYIAVNTDLYPNVTEANGGPVVDFNHSSRSGSNASFFVPVRFIEPIGFNAKAAGFDLASHPDRLLIITFFDPNDNPIFDRLNALVHARDMCEITVTKTITLIQETENQLAILLFAPAYNRSKAESIGSHNPHLRVLLFDDLI